MQKYYKIPRQEIMPLADKVIAITNISIFTTKNQQGSCKLLTNYYKDMW